MLIKSVLVNLSMLVRVTYNDAYLWWRYFGSYVIVHDTTKQAEFFQGWYLYISIFFGKKYTLKN